MVKEVCVATKLTKGGLCWIVLCQLGSTEPHFQEFHFCFFFYSELELAKRGTCAGFERQKYSSDYSSMRVAMVRCGDGQIQRCLVGPSDPFPLTFKHLFPIFKNLTLDLMSPPILPSFILCCVLFYLLLSPLLLAFVTPFPLKLLSLFFSQCSFFLDFHYCYMLMVL